MLDLAKWEAALVSGSLGERDNAETDVDADAARGRNRRAVRLRLARRRLQHAPDGVARRRPPRLLGVLDAPLDEGLSIYVLTNAEDVDTAAIAANVALLHLPSRP